ncbi:hypothetical protein Thpro_021048 [Acidihalobacter prosperus]|uniref:Uncharacterized protein n=1 Tax=Acidihalobacter prosperus TaxID=160660 RepID=A0A1A6C619_9GAMM|nr:hypothetical protein Thpro_021048 [Acidihalobacter prosperus]
MLKNHKHCHNIETFIFKWQAITIAFNKFYFIDIILTSQNPGEPKVLAMKINTICIIPKQVQNNGQFPRPTAKIQYFKVLT